MASGDTKTEAMLNALGNGGSADEFRGCCNTKTQQYILDAIDRVQNVEDEVEELKNNPDVVDIVDTYADLQAYDTQHLTENDIIRVLQDETHSGNSTYYRFTKNPDTWTFIGEISGGSSVNVVQTTGTSTTDVMSQNAVTSMVFADPSTMQKIKIGASTTNGSSDSVVIGASASSSNSANDVAIGKNARCYNGNECIAIGCNANTGSNGSYSISVGSSATTASNQYSVALGAGATATRGGEVNISTKNNHGYNSTNYRVLGGVHDPVDAHDAATKGYVDAHAGGVTPVQTTGTSTTDVMSQNAVTSMVYGDPSTKNKVNINGGSSNTGGAYSVNIGAGASSTGDHSVSLGYVSGAGGEKGVALGRGADAGHVFSVALGAGSTTSAQGEINVGTGNIYTTKGYNNSNYRLLSGLYDGQSAHDAATVGQINATIDAINTALSTNIPHIGA